jgi:major membrane immunogen (membrane-anchored lipoprotein)
MKLGRPRSIYRSLQNLSVGLLLFASSSTLAIAASASEVGNPQALADGTYLYGESTQADQVGKAYVVFTQKNGRVIGAIYHPQSEFSCFSGAVKGNALDTVTQANVGQPAQTLQIPLSNLHLVPTQSLVSASTLNACKQEIAAQESTQPRASRK